MRARQPRSCADKPPMMELAAKIAPRSGGAGYRIRNDQSGGVPLCVNYLTLGNRCRWQPRTRGAIDSARSNMQMQQIRYFLALCEERSFTRAAKRCGVSQPSLTNAIIRLEQKLGGALFQRKPLVSLTVLGDAVHPYFDRIAQNVEQAREAAAAMADVRRSTFMPLQPSGLS